MRPALLLILACGCGGPQPATTATPTGDAPPPDQAPTPTEATIELHEWGLLDVAANGQAELSAGPGRPARPVIARKPVIYAHLRGVESAAFSLGVTVEGGAIVEHWPTGRVDGGSLVWPRVDVRRGACPGIAGRESPPCGSTDGFCESSELGRYGTDDHDCMTVESYQSGLLFYRASARGDALPLRAARNADGSVSITALRDMAGAPGSIVRIAQGQVARADFPAAGQSVSIGVPSTPIDPSAERAALEQGLATLGLTPSEAHAFMEAWAAELFGGDASRGPARRWRDDRAAAAQDILLYWMPPAQIDSIAALSVDPVAEVHRALLVRVALAP